VPLLNRPFLEYQLALLRQHGVTDIVLACSYRVEDVEAVMGRGEARGVHLRYAVESAPLGTAGALRNAADLTRGRLIVLNGDVLADADLTAMMRFHGARGSRTTIYLVPVDDPTRFGVVETAGDGAIRAFTEKPSPDRVTTNMINAGIYIIEHEVLEEIPTGRPVSIERETFPGLLAAGVPCYGFTTRGYWRDIGSLEAYRQAQVDLLEGRVATTLCPPGARTAGCWIGADTRLDVDTSLLPPAVLGGGAQTAAGARIGPLTVVGDGARIGAGATLENALLWERVQVGPRARLRGCIVGSDARIGADAEIGPGGIVESGAVVPERTRLP
jgi:NDP-sugar pyrophosphorylase family protein